MTDTPTITAIARRISYAWCWLCYHLVLWLPQNKWTFKAELWLMQYAGAYAYSTDFDDFRENAFRASAEINAPTTGAK